MVLDQLLLSPNEGDGYAARQRCGERAGIIGIGVNLILFAVKLAVGVACGAVAVVADALNNLSDAGTSLAMIFGFRIAGREIVLERIDIEKDSLSKGKLIEEKNN